MSGYFDGRDGRLSKTCRFRRCGNSVKTLGDLRDLGDLQFEEICCNWNCCRFTWQVFDESPESYLSPSRGAVWGYLGRRFDIWSLWGLHKMHETLWFCLV